MSFPRYPAYKDSGVEWLGEVPEHWLVEPLKRQIERNDGGVWGDDPEGAADTIVLRSTEQTVDGQWKIEDPAFRKVNDREKNSSLLFAGDLLLTKSSGSSLHIGKTTLVDDQIESLQCCFSNFMQRIRLKGTFRPRLGWYVLNNKISRLQLDLFSNSTSGLANLNAAIIGQILIPIPPENEQLNIVSFLDKETAKIDALITEQQRLIELLQEKRQAVISHAVTKGLNPDVPMKDSGVEWLGEVPEHWEVSPLKFLARIGNGSTPNRDNSGYWADDGFPWLNSSVVNQAEVFEAERFVTQLALNECHLPIIEPPAVLVGITGQGKTRGMAAPLRFVATLNQHVAYIKPYAKSLDVDYLQRALEAAYVHLRTESEGVGSTKGAITCEQLGAWKMPIPPLPEQAAIASFLKEEAARLDTLKDESDLAISLLHERRSALISAAVTGQIDVRRLAYERV